MATVLILDDDKTTLTFLNTILGNEGHTVICAPNGVTGLARFKEDRPQLLFVDIFMPGVNGIKVIQEIRDIDSNVPIVAISAGVPGQLDANAFLKYALQSGANISLRKPLHKAQVVALVGSLVGPASPSD